MRNLLMVLLGFAGFHFSASAQNLTRALSLANTIQSNMVIQQDRPFKVWGYAKPGTEVFVKADWMKEPVKTITASSNEWLLQIPVPKAVPTKPTPHRIMIRAGKDTIHLSNILIGEVWLCSGQSNMDMEIKPFLPWLKGALNYEQEIAAANYPAIRLYNVRTDFKAAPENDCKGGEWKICTPKTAGDFSAVAYFFARELYNQLHVPVGLVVSSVGASSCQAWTGRNALQSDPVLNEKYLYPYDTSARSKLTLDSVVDFEKVLRPTLFYNAMIYPLRNLSVRGFLWYQGESNKDDKEMYTRVCAAMIGNWRELFNQGELPFYYVQVAPYNWEQKDTTAFNYAMLREAQDAIRKKVKNTGMAVIMDISEPDDIHPRNKQGVGLRLAKNALAQTYGRKHVVYQGPEFSKMETDGEKVKISFSRIGIGSGLTTSDKQAPRHFYIAGTDSVFHYAEAKIVNNQVWLTSEKVKKPVAVRYAFTNFPVTNFCNKEGLPALPFRTDKPAF